MKHRKYVDLMKKSIAVLELILAGVVAIAVILGMPDLFKYFVGLITFPKDASYIIFGDFLKHTLMLVVGLELMIMILTHSNESILTLVLFVIARKMLVYADGMLDIFIGSISMAVIFLVLKFMMLDEKMLAKYDNTFSAALPVAKIKREFGYDIPQEKSVTLGGLIYEISMESGEHIEEGSTLVHDGIEYHILSMTDGVIERVQIKELQ